MPVQVVISWVGAGSTSISDTGADYSIDAPEPGVRPPESAQGEISGLYGVMIYRIQQW